MKYVLITYLTWVLIACSANQAPVDSVQMTGIPGKSDNLGDSELSLEQQMEESILSLVNFHRLEDQLTEGMKQASPLLAMGVQLSKHYPLASHSDFQRDHTLSSENYWYVGTSEDALFSSGGSVKIDVWEKTEGGDDFEKVDAIQFPKKETLGAIRAIYSLTGGMADPEELILERKILRGGAVNSKTSASQTNNSEFVLQWLDLDENNLSHVDTSFQFTGELVTSKQFDDSLMVITRSWGERFSSSLPGNDSDLNAECYSSNNRGVATPSIIEINVINLSSKEVIDSACLNIHAKGIYVVEDKVYLLESISNVGNDFSISTDVHLLTIDKYGLDYASSLEIPGEINYSDFESNLTYLSGRLVVVTTDRDSNWNPVHGIYYVAANTKNELELFNMDAQESELKDKILGKHELEQVKIIGERVYLCVEQNQTVRSAVVSFSGVELKLLGAMDGAIFESNSDYEQWVGLSGQRQLVLSHYRGQATEKPSISISLIDLSDIKNPKIARDYVFASGGTYSEAVFDSKALSIKDMGDELFRLTFPASFNKLEHDGSTTWDYTSLQVWTIVMNNKIFSLLPDTELLLAQSGVPASSEQRKAASRVRTQDEMFFFLYDDQVVGPI